MWKDLEKGFQFAFGQAWAAFCGGNIPIGACVLNEDGDVMALGRNQVEVPGEGPIAGHQLAHAEANCILQLSETGKPNSHPDIRKYRLFTTMEPCPFCFGAIAMGSIKHVRFAARDGYAGVVDLNGRHPYLIRKRVVFEGPFQELEPVQIAMQACYELQRNPGSAVIPYLERDCPQGVQAARELVRGDTLVRMARQGAGMADVYDRIAAMIGCAYN